MHSFAADQEAHKKDIERDFGVLKIKFLSLTHPINLHHHDDIYYLVLCAILQHNMMVEAHLEDGEKESSAMYNTLELTAAESGNVDCGHSPSDEDNIAELEINGSMQQQLRFEISHKRWSTLYNRKGALKLKSAMMLHLFKQNLVQMQ